MFAKNLSLKFGETEEEEVVEVIVYVFIYIRFYVIGR